MLRLAGHTCAHDHNGNGAVRAHKPVQNGSGLGTETFVVSAMSKTGWAFGLSVFSSFNSRGRSPFVTAITARGAALLLGVLPASLADLFNDRCGQFANRSTGVGARALRHQFLKRQHHLPASVVAPLHRRVLSEFRSSDGSTKPRTGLNDRQILFADSTKARTHD